MTFLDEMYLISTLADDHDTEHNGEHWTTPSILRDDRKETNGEEASRAAVRAPRT